MAIELKDWTLEVWKFDRRRKEGKFLEKTYQYRQTHEGWMHEELRDLGGLYPADRYHLRFVETSVVVRSLMTGEEVVLHYTEVGGPCDPSTERFWSM